MDDFLSDLVYALRRLGGRPAVTGLAMVSLALGIGVTSAVFSLIDGIFLRPLPVRDAHRLVWVEYQGLEGGSAHTSYPDFLDLRAQTGAFEDLVAESRRAAMLNLQGLSKLVLLSVVSDDYFPALGVEMAVGRPFEPALAQELAREPAVIISHSLWIRQFGRDPQIVGRAINLNRKSYTVVGVAGPAFRGTQRSVTNDVWVPLTTWVAMATSNLPERDDRGIRVFQVLGHLAPGSTPEAAQSQLDVIAERLRRDFPDIHAHSKFRVVSETWRRRTSAWSMSVLLLPVIGTVLLIACANASSLLLAEGLARSREVAVRVALGASRLRLVRQFFAESMALAVLGGLAGLLVAWALLGAVPALSPPGPVPLTLDLTLDGRVLSLTALVTLLSILLVGLVPAIRGSRVEVVSGLKDDTRAGGGRSWLQKTLAVAQAGICLVLVASALLLVRSLAHTQKMSPGFDAERPLVLAWIALRLDSDRAAAPAMLEELSRELSAAPGVERVSFARRMHLSPSGGGATLEVTPPGDDPMRPEPLRVKFNQVAANYFQTVGTRILKGRAFNEFDREGSARVVIVSELAASRFWPERDPIDQQLRVRGQLSRVVGVAEDSKLNGLHEDPEPYLYAPFDQFPSSEATLLVQSSGDAKTLIPWTRRRLLSRSADLELLGLLSLRELMDQALYDDRLPTAIASAAAAIGLLLAAVGLYAFMARTVRQRTREIGIRIALGAQRGAVLRQILKEGLLIGLWALPLGLVGSIAVSRVMAAYLYGVQPGDGLSLGLAALITLVMAALASYRSARRASRLDPVIALRYE